LAAGLIGGEAHDAAAAAGEHADVGADEAGELVDEAEMRSVSSFSSPTAEP
jgi:hypothetical protein